MLMQSGSSARQPAATATPVVLSDAVLNRLPEDWRAPAAKHVRAAPFEQDRFLTVSEEVLRQTLARLLARVAAADVPAQRAAAEAARATARRLDWADITARFESVLEGAIARAEPVFALPGLQPAS